jgi:hypothetical protein
MPEDRPLKTRNLRALIVVLGIVLGLQSNALLNHNSSDVVSTSTLVPQLIRQGPLEATFAPSGYYWYQIGAIGDANSNNSDGSNVTIRTVYDQVRNDAHSYWVGTLLSTGGFVQVGYLNGLSTTGQAYCCAWFFETFYTPKCSCPPVIGPEGSAGPVGSWHTYSMIHTGNGIWSFYMDGNLLGQSPPPTNPNYLGTGATSSGGHSPAGVAEVAQAIDNRDIIGPAEFKDIEMRQGGAWQSMLSASTYCCTGYMSQTGLPISYGVQEVEGHNNDFLAGSNIRQPAATTALWPTSTSPNPISFTFLDSNGGSFAPDWISLQEPGTNNIHYYTSYSFQGVPSSGTGIYTVTYASWHGVNVAKNSLISDSVPSQTIQGNVFSIPIRVVGRFYSLPVNRATVLTFLPDSTNETLQTDSEGNATLTQLPPGNYSLRVTVPYGVQSVFRTSVTGPGNISISVFGIAELLTVIMPPIVVAIAVVVLALRREQVRRASLPTALPLPTTIPAAFCGACGKPLGPLEFFCTTCGTPRARSPQPPSSQQLPGSSSASTPPP